MQKSEQPVLSICMIFKNEIRCLERCMKSLQRLRDTIPCELVMADTGATDGSREIAEKYADILIDFPWINDFAAARNAVLDRASGEWLLVMDADEWLDDNIDELVFFLLSPEVNRPYPAGAFIVRNYSTAALDGDYSDFLAVRMVRRSTGNRYVGAIHEHWKTNMDNLHGFGKSVLHHDGYVNFGGESGKTKRERNQKLLHERLKKEPENMLLLLQCMESGTDGAEQEYYIRQALDCVQRKLPTWEQVGPAIYRYAIMLAKQRGLMELEQWAGKAQELFPDNLFTRIDIAYSMFLYHLEKKEYADAIRYGEMYLEAAVNYRTNYDRIADLVYSSLVAGSPSYEQRIRVYMADAYFYEKDFQKARDMLLSVDSEKASATDIKNCVGIMMNLHAQSGLDMRDAAAALWDRICAETSPKKRMEERKGAYVSTAAIAFPSSYRQQEGMNNYRHAYTLFLPLAGKCGVGTGAALLDSSDATYMTELLVQQEDLNLVPIAAIVHAMKHGVRFPLPGKAMYMEEMDLLAGRLANDKDALFSFALQEAEQPDLNNPHKLLWARGLVMAAVQAYPWGSKDEDSERGFKLACAFARIEKKFLPHCYSAETLQEEGLFMLPPMHRFGWYCMQALSDLDRGEFAACVKKLRAGLSAYSGAAKMVDFLLGQVADLERSARIATAPPELVALADQVKVMLARFKPDDPAVAELKSSPVYKQVAWLIETPAQSPFGVLPQ